MVATKLNIKEEIKSLALNLRAKKQLLKHVMKAYSTKWKEEGMDSNTWYKYPEKYHSIKPTLEKMEVLQHELQNDKEAFRAKHIVNSMCKGKSLSQIEPKTRDSYEYRCIRNMVYMNAKNILAELGKEWIE